MYHEKFIENYQAALATQDWKALDPLVCDEVVVSFSNGSVHIGKDKVQQAFETNFNSIKSESYEMKNIHWLKKKENYAVYVFEYYWSGILNGKSVSGNGIGTSIIIQEAGNWKLLSEHLGKQMKTN